MGEWKFFSKEDDFTEAMLSYAETNNVFLDKDGTWTLGNSKGKWGGDGDDLTWGSWKQDYKNLDLKFADYEVEISNHANQFDAIDGAICIVDGIEVLRVSVNYTYDSNNFYENSFGETDSYTSQSIGSVTYLFLRKESAQEDLVKVQKHFKDKKRRWWGMRWFLNDFYPAPSNYLRKMANNKYFEDEIGGLEYNFERDTADTEQKLILSGIYLFKQQPDKAIEVINRINPIEREDSVSAASMTFIARSFTGLDSIDYSESALWNFYLINDFMNMLLSSGKVTSDRLTSIKTIEDSVKVIRDNSSRVFVPRNPYNSSK